MAALTHAVTAWNSAEPSEPTQHAVSTATDTAECQKARAPVGHSASAPRSGSVAAASSPSQTAFSAWQAVTSVGHVMKTSLSEKPGLEETVPSA